MYQIFRRARRGQIGILSKRIPLNLQKTKENLENSKENLEKTKENLENALKNEENSTFLVNKYALPRGLRSIPRENRANLAEKSPLRVFSQFFRTKPPSFPQETELKQRIKRIIEKKKQFSKENAQKKLRNSLESWAFLTESQRKREKNSYSGRLKELRGEISRKNVEKLIKSAFSNKI